MEYQYRVEVLQIYRDVEHDRRSAEKVEAICKTCMSGAQAALAMANPAAALALSVWGAFEPVTQGSHGNTPPLLFDRLFLPADGR